MPDQAPPFLTAAPCLPSSAMQLGPFDGVFFDTYGEYYEASPAARLLPLRHALLPCSLARRSECGGRRGWGRGQGRRVLQELNFALIRPWRFSTGTLQDMHEFHEKLPQ